MKMSQLNLSNLRKNNKQRETTEKTTMMRMITTVDFWSQ